MFWRRFTTIPSSPYSPLRVRAPSTKWENSSFDGALSSRARPMRTLFSIRTANARTSANDNSVFHFVSFLTIERRCRVASYAQTIPSSVVTAVTLAQASRAMIKQRARSRRKVGRPTMQWQSLFRKTQHVESHLVDLTLLIRVTTIIPNAKCLP